jgi:hypothetical protein
VKCTRVNTGFDKLGGRCHTMVRVPRQICGTT